MFNDLILKKSLLDNLALRVIWY